MDFPAWAAQANSFPAARTPQLLILPGEGKIPSDWLRDKDFDIDAFPDLHVTGKNGLDKSREIPLSRDKYFAQRILDVNPMYAKNPDYVFMAQQAKERHAIERQISMAMSHGSIETNENGQV